MPAPTEETVKKTIRALLTSSKGGCSPRQLMNDYKFVTGGPIPYESFGFDSLMSYLNSLKDVLTVSRSRDRTTLYAVHIPSTMNITRMVSKQRSSSSSFIHSKKPPELPSASQTRSTSSSTPLPSVPATIKINLESLMLSYPNGIALNSLQEAFARRFGFYFSFKAWGFLSLEDMVKSIPTVLQLEKDPVRKTLNVRSAPHSSSTGDEAAGIDWAKLKRERRVSEEKTREKPIPTSPLPQESLFSLESSPPRQVSINVDKASFLANLKKTSVQHPAARRSLPKKLIEQVKDLLEANPSGLWVSRFPEEFESHYHTPFPVSAYGYSSVVHLLSAISICAMEKPMGMGDWLVFLKGLPTPEAAQGRKLELEAYVSETEVKRIHHLFKVHPDGIPLKDFPAIFKDVYSEQLPYEEYGFHSLSELLQMVRGVEVVKPSTSNVLLVRQTRPLTEEEESGPSKKLTPVSLPTPGPPQPSVYSVQDVPKEPSMFPVYVAHVKTPSCFTIQLLGEKTSRTLEQLQEDITKFYTGLEEDKYRINTPYVGQPCCAIFNNDGTWYRAEIEQIPEPDVVSVKYVDYGNSGQVPLGSIRQPKAHYLIFPAQGIKCRLANLKPAGSTWSRRAAQLMYQMTKDKPIVAIKTTYKKHVLSVCLCDTNTTKDIHINDTLVDQGLAIFTPDTEQDCRDLDGFQLEGTAVQSTEEVPRVRLPEEGGKMATLPTSIASTGPTSQSQPAPPLASLPTTDLQSQNLLQLSYLQQLMMLQPHLFLGQINPMLSASLLSTPGLAGLTGHTGQVGVANLLGTASGEAVSLPPGFATPVQPTVSTPVTSPASQMNLPVPSQTSLASQSTSLPSTDLTNTVTSQTVPHTSVPKTSLVVSSPKSEQEEESAAFNFLDNSSTSSSDVFCPSVVKRSSKGQLLKERKSFWDRPVVWKTKSAYSKDHVIGTDQSSARDVRGDSGSVVEQSLEERSATTGWTVKCMKATPPKYHLLKRVILTPDHSLCVLRHNDRAYFLSAQVSRWFWDSDLLKTQLREAQKSVWGQLLHHKQARALFQELHSDESCHDFLEWRQREITIYNLEDLPLVVSTFNAPPDLCAKVEAEVSLWKSRGLEYFSDSPNNGAKSLKDELESLQLKRKDILTSMMENPNLAGGLTQLIELEKEIELIKNELSSSQDQPRPSLNSYEKPHPLPLESESPVSLMKGENPLINEDLNMNEELAIEASDSGVVFAEGQGDFILSSEILSEKWLAVESSSTQSPPPSSRSQCLSCSSRASSISEGRLSHYDHDTNPVEAREEKKSFPRSAEEEQSVLVPSDRDTNLAESHGEEESFPLSDGDKLDTNPEDTVDGDKLDTNPEDTVDGDKLDMHSEDVVDQLVHSPQDSSVGEFSDQNSIEDESWVENKSDSLKSQSEVFDEEGVTNFPLSSKLFVSSDVEVSGSHTPPMRAVVQDVDTPPMRAVVQDVDTPPTRAVVQDVDTPPMRAVVQDVDTPPTRAVVQDVDTPPMRAGVQDVDTPPMRAVVQNVDMPPMRAAGVQDVDTPPTRAVVQDVDTPPTRAVVQDVDTPPTRAVVQDVDTPPTRAAVQDVDTPPTRAVVQDVDTPPTRAVVQDVDTPPTRAVVQDVDTPPMRAAGVQDVDMPPTRAVVQDVDTPPMRAGVQDMDTPPTRAVVQDVDTPPMRAVVQDVDTPPMRTVVQDVDMPPMRVVVQDVDIEKWELEFSADDLDCSSQYADVEESCPIVSCDPDVPPVCQEAPPTPDEENTDGPVSPEVLEQSPSGEISEDSLSNLSEVKAESIQGVLNSNEPVTSEPTDSTVPCQRAESIPVKGDMGLGSPLEWECDQATPIKQEALGKTSDNEATFLSDPENDQTLQFCEGVSCLASGTNEEPLSETEELNTAADQTLIDKPCTGLSNRPQTPPYSAERETVCVENPNMESSTCTYKPCVSLSTGTAASPLAESEEYCWSFVERTVAAPTSHYAIDFIKPVYTHSSPLPTPPSTSIVQQLPPRFRHTPVLGLLPIPPRHDANGREARQAYGGYPTIDHTRGPIMISPYPQYPPYLRPPVFCEGGFVFHPPPMEAPPPRSFVPPQQRYGPPPMPYQYMYMEGPPEPEQPPFSPVFSRSQTLPYNGPLPVVMPHTSNDRRQRRPSSAIPILRPSAPGANLEPPVRPKKQPLSLKPVPTMRINPPLTESKQPVVEFKMAPETKQQLTSVKTKSKAPSPAVVHPVSPPLVKVETKRGKAKITPPSQPNAPKVNQDVTTPVSTNSSVNTTCLVSLSTSAVCVVTTSMSGVGIPSVTSPGVGLGRGRMCVREHVAKKRSARSIGLGRGLSPGVVRDRRPGGMNS